MVSASIAGGWIDGLEVRRVPRIRLDIRQETCLTGGTLAQWLIMHVIERNTALLLQ